jgi:hypothetical protein
MSAPLGMTTMAPETLTKETGAAPVDRPVTIALDSSKKLADLTTRAPIPPFTEAQRGSIQFFLERLNEPLNYLTYFKEGTNHVPIDRLFKIVKVQEPWGIWRLYYRGPVDGFPLTQNVRTTAVSMIPRSRDGTPGKRICMLLSDLSEINWGNDY